jgi:hypothetical protein
MYYCISVFMVASFIHFYYIIGYLRYLYAFLYYISTLIYCRKIIRIIEALNNVFSDRHSQNV